MREQGRGTTSGRNRATPSRLRQSGSTSGVRSSRHTDVSATSSSAFFVTRARLIIIGSVILIVALAVTSGLIWLTHHTPSDESTRGPFPTVLTFAANPIACPAAATWSPDSSRIAVVGFGSCPQNQSVPASGAASNLLLSVYSAASGHVEATTDASHAVEDALPESIRSNPALLGQAQVVIGAVVWSSVGNQIAVNFTTFHDDPNGNGPATAYRRGLLLMAGSSAPHVIVAPQSDQDEVTPSVSNGSTTPLSLTRWDLTAGSAAEVQLPQALGYSWNDDGTLSPTLPLPLPASATPAAIGQTPPGNPINGHLFSAFQMGSLGFGYTCSGANTTCCIDTSGLASTFGALAAWSPDGRYLITSPTNSGLVIGATGKLAAAPPNANNVQGACSGPPTAGHIAALPVRDAGLRNGLRAFDFSRVGVVVGWSLDGTRIAIRADHSLSGSAHELSIFGTRSGNLLASYSAQQVEHGLPTNRGGSVQFVGPGIPPVWSPDGTHLMILDNDLRVLSILGPNMLGR